MLNFLLGLVANLLFSFSIGGLTVEAKMTYEIWVTPKDGGTAKLYSKSGNLDIAKKLAEILSKGGAKAEVKGPFVNTNISYDPNKNSKPTFGVSGTATIGLPGGPGVTLSGSAGTGQKPTFTATPGTGPTPGTASMPGTTTPKPTTTTTTPPKPTTTPVSTTPPATTPTPKPTVTTTPAPKPTAPVSTTPTEKDTPWMAIARDEIGQKEVAGAKHNPRIVEYHQTTSLKAKDDETAWCSSFANWVMKEAGIKGTNSAAARSWLDWGKKLDKPVPGAVVVFWRGSPTAATGHVAFYVGEEGDKVLVLGGNQSNGVNISKYAKSQILGYRMPN